MDSLYTPDVRRRIHNAPWPVRLRWRVVELEEELKFKLYRDNINSLSGEEKLFFANLLNDTLSKISASGVPIFVWVVEGDGVYDEQE